MLVLSTCDTVDTPSVSPPLFTLSGNLFEQPKELVWDVYLVLMVLTGVTTFLHGLSVGLAVLAKSALFPMVSFAMTALA